MGSLKISSSMACVFFAAMVMLAAGAAWAEVNCSGDSTCSSDGPGGYPETVTVGWSDTGHMTIDGGSVYEAGNMEVGFMPYATGSTISVDGSGSLLDVKSWITLGEFADCALNITDNGVVDCGGISVKGSRNDGFANSSINFNGGTLNATSLNAGAADLRGTGVINTGGIVSDIDLVFASPDDLNQTIVLNSYAGQNITVNLSVNENADLGAGWAGSGSITIKNGVEIRSAHAYLGRYRGSSCRAEISGPGTLWQCGDMYTVYGEDLDLRITDGARLESNVSYFSSNGNTHNHVEVSGSGSTWQFDELRLGGGLNSKDRVNNFVTVDITDGGCMTGSLCVLDATFNLSSVTMNISGEGSKLVLSGPLFIHDANDNINMSSGAMLALFGDIDDDLSEFFTMTDGTGNINYFNADTGQWENITGATEGEDYTLVYHDSGEFAGFTVLTVMAVPEPATLGIFALGALAVMRRKLRVA